MRVPSERAWRSRWLRAQPRRRRHLRSPGFGPRPFGRRRKKPGAKSEVHIAFKSSPLHSHLPARSVSLRRAHPYCLRCTHTIPRERKKQNGICRTRGGENVDLRCRSGYGGVLLAPGYQKRRPNLQHIFRLRSPDRRGGSRLHDRWQPLSNLLVNFRRTAVQPRRSVAPIAQTSKRGLLGKLIYDGTRKVNSAGTLSGPAKPRPSG